MALFSLIAAALSKLDPDEAAEDASKRPVVLVHGIFCTKLAMSRMAKMLRAQGRKVLAPTLWPSTGSLPIDALAAQLRDEIEKHFPAGKFDLVGFSMGGLIARYYLQRLGGLERVEHFITAATPHHGTHAAFVLPGPGVRQMRPGSDFLNDLASDADRLREVKFTSFYTPLDLVILPPRSSIMPQARNVKFWAASHPSWLFEKRCLRAIASVLDEPAKATEVSCPSPEPGRSGVAVAR